MNVHVQPKHHSPRQYSDVEGLIGDTEFRRLSGAVACDNHLMDLRRYHLSREPTPVPIDPQTQAGAAVSVGPTRHEQQLAKRRAEIDAIRALYPVAREQRVSVARIQTVVASYFYTTVHELCSPRRSAEIVTPRQIAMLICKRLTYRSLSEIGRLFGGRDHSTALHSIRKYEKLTRTDPQWAELVEVISETIKALP